MNTKPKLTRARNLSLSDADYARLRELGNGNASEGVREALRRSEDNEREQLK